MLLNFNLKRKKQVQNTEVLKYAFLPAVVHLKNNAGFLPRSVFPQNEDKNRFVCCALVPQHRFLNNFEQLCIYLKEINL